MTFETVFPFLKKGIILDSATVSESLCTAKNQVLA